MAFSGLDYDANYAKAESFLGDKFAIICGFVLTFTQFDAEMSS
jgi:hypothetical protein